MVDGHTPLWPLHEARMRLTAQACGFRLPRMEAPEEMCPASMRRGFVKCRIIYRDEIENITFDSYEPRKIASLCCLPQPAIDYQWKKIKRDALDTLRLGADADEVVMYNGEGLLTDTTYTNILLEKEPGVWHMPRQPLLEGVMKSALWIAAGNAPATPLEEAAAAYYRTAPEAFPSIGPFEQIEKRDISLRELAHYHRIALINAMLPPEEAIILPLCSCRLS